MADSPQGARTVATPTDIVWSRVEEGFHVGSADGEFLGYVDRGSDGRYLAFDRHSLALGAFADLGAATAAVESAPRPTGPSSGAAA